MAKKDYFIVIDTETTQDSLVADFGAIICDRKGKIYNQCAVLVNGIYNNPKEHPLFYTSDENPIWGKPTLDKRYKKYNNMLESGTRMIASVNAVNRWLERAMGKYNPILTAYNLAFDVDKCQNTEIDLSIFDKRFCLWYAAAEKWGKSKRYKQFILNNHYFNTPTELRNMTYVTNAEVMARFVLGNPNLPDEPHTSLEDIVGYELPILARLVNRTKKAKFMNPKAYNWKEYQVKDHFSAK